MEFGMLKCKVKSISLVPLSTENGAIYTVEIELPNDLITNYDKKTELLPGDDWICRNHNRRYQTS
jgi:hypothetical protein